MRQFGLYIALLLSLGGAVALGDTFTLTVENVGVQPLTPVFVATHDATFDIFNAGAAASAELVAIAEGGDTGPMQMLASGAAGVLDYGVIGMAPIPPGGSDSIALSADATHPYLSFASMLPITNDAFIGLAAGDGALDLFRGGSPMFYDFTLSYLEVWDAGSEINTELAADVPGLGGMGSPDEGGVISRPHPGILGVGDIGPEYDFFGLDIARIMVVPEPGGLALLCGLLVGALVTRGRR